MHHTVQPYEVNCITFLQFGQPIRLLLKYVGANFEDVRYTHGGGTDLFVCPMHALIVSDKYYIAS